MKQTAVEWLQEGLELVMSYEEQMQTIGLFEQAKEMEKEQIKDAYLKNHLQGCWMKKSAEEFAEEYYNETFKQ